MDILKKTNSLNEEYKEMDKVIVDSKDSVYDSLIEETDAKEIYKSDNLIRDLKICFQESGLTNYSIATHPLQLADIFVDEEQQTFSVFEHGCISISSVRGIRFFISPESSGNNVDENYVRILTDEHCIYLYFDKEASDFETVINEDGEKLVAEAPEILDFLHYRSLAKKSADNMFIENGILRAYYCDEPREQLKIPSTVKEISPYAFYECTEIGRISMTGVTVHSAAFENAKIRELYITASQIRPFAFFNCKQLEKTVFTNVKYIGRSAFSHSGIRYIDLPNSLEFVFDTAFEFCTDLESVRFSDQTVFGDNVFYGTPYQKRLDAEILDFS